MDHARDLRFNRQGCVVAAVEGLADVGSTTLGEC